MIKNGLEVFRCVYLNGRQPTGFMSIIWVWYGIQKEENIFVPHCYLRPEAHQRPYLIEKSKPERERAAITAEHQSEWMSISVSIRMNKSTLSSKLISLKLKFYFRRAWTFPW